MVDEKSGKWGYNAANGEMVDRAKAHPTAFSSLIDFSNEIGIMEV
jgi:hypothetical protein